MPLYKTCSLYPNIICYISLCLYHKMTAITVCYIINLFTGLVKLNSPDLLGESTWQHRHCAIRNGVFECFKDDSTSSDLEFSLLLTDYELLAHAPEKDSLSLTVTRQGQVAFIIEVGKWLANTNFKTTLYAHQLFARVKVQALIWMIIMVNSI